MCDGFPMFAAAFDTKIDLRGYEIVQDALENAPEVAITAQTGKRRGKMPLRGFRAFLGRLRPFSGP